MVTQIAKGGFMNPDMHELTLVHMQMNEIKALVKLQSTVTQDPEPVMEYVDGFGDVYAFPHLGPLFDDPNVSHIFMESIRGGKNPQEKNVFGEMEKIGNSIPIPHLDKNPRGETKFQKKIAHMGEGGDDEMALIPENLFILFGELEGGKIHINSKTGLAMFGRFLGMKFSNPVTEIVRAAATVAGFIAGGPAGAGVGNFIGKVATGAKPSQQFIPALKVAALAYGAQQLPGMLGNFGATGTQAAGHGAAQMAGQAAGQAGTQAAGQAAAQQAAQTAAKGWGSGALNFLKENPLLATAGVYGLSMLGNKQQEKDEEKALKRLNEEYERRRKRAGYDEPWKEPNLPTRRPYSLDNGHSPQNFFAAYREGGHVVKDVSFAIKGPGDGQADRIKTKLEPGSFISDATSIAHMGNGDTESGLKVLKKFINSFPRPMGRRERVKKVDALVANGEAYIPRDKVTSIGGGSNEEGGRLLQHMIHNLRKHKASNGDKLPPPALPLRDYMFGHQN